MRQFTDKQVAGYRANLKGAINACDNGAEVTLDITTARALVKICDQAIFSEDEHDKPLFDPASVRHSKGTSTAPGTVNFSKDGEIHHTTERKREQNV